MRVLVTGIRGYVGSRLVPRLLAGGHDVRGFSRRTGVMGEVPVVRGDAISGQGLEQALEDVDAAYFLIHSMEPSPDGPFAVREHAAAKNFAAAAAAAGTKKIIYLGGLVPPEGAASAHLRSRLAVERILHEATPCSVALRASIVIGADSRSFRLLVRLVERMPVLPVPAWGIHRTAPIDERDVVELLARAAESEAVCGQSFDIGGPEILAYGELVERIRDHLLVGRPTVKFKRASLTPITSRVVAHIAGEDHELIGPLMESLERDLIPSDDRLAELLGVKLHSMDAAIERSLRELESVEPLAAR